MSSGASGEAKTVWEALKIASSLLSVCVGGIFSSVLVYRAAFHRLNRFPGPFLARLSNLYVTLLSVKKFHLYEEIQALHHEYGDIVRVGPSELSIADPKVVDLIHSNQSPCYKGPWYNILHPIRSLHTVRDQKEHARRRKTWDKGLGSKALRDYEPRVAEYTAQLLQKLDESQGEPLNMSTWFNFYSFDVMGDLAFGKGFNMLKDGLVHYYMESVHASMLAVGAFSHLVWIFPLLKAIPLVNSEHLRFQKWLADQVRQRRERKTDATDLFSWILADYDAIGKPTPQDTVNLHGDAHLIVVAGSDTTAASLTCLFFELALHPRVVDTLRAEMDAYFAENQRPAAQSLSKLEYLQACINESLRLHQPVPSGLQRMTPLEGLQLGDTFVPGSTIVQVPTYTLYRDERVFLQANEFIPERWASRPELVRDASVFAPFSAGRYSCAGKQLGLMELRYVTSQIIHRYDVRMAPKQSADSFLGGLRDAFTLSSQTLDLSFQCVREAPAGEPAT
ncbi:Tryprostatin B 6-hydroxylase [Tolypocladium ophioglossoides CBS 100239]|uniref:Tryprostatin B 6-hydroxylase n=1 Tax=Tolypocladium ophioglossoides (strain CBS 100239) TaxID=1163406 RepID=A0A0L0N9G5_TOLOC|nr:Tryprostatin B 6-hydroxylase [Tolypocladium ophioglossoides CBS 100239]